MNSKYDWAAIEREYVKGDMSLREIARKYGMAGHSLVTGQSKRRGWAKKRADFREGADDTALSYMAADEGARRAQEARVRDHAIDAIDEAIERMRADMRSTHKVLEENTWVDRPLYLVKPADVAMLIDRLQVLFGKPSNITEERSLGINLTSGGATPELLRSIVEATRGVGGPSDATASPIPRSDRAREN